MEYIRKFENFNMHRDNCDRCGNPTNNQTIQSMYNDEVICMNCKREEEKRPDYQEAVNKDSIEHLTKLMNLATKEQDFAKAAKYRDAIHKIRTGERYRETEE